VLEQLGYSKGEIIMSTITMQERIQMSVNFMKEKSEEIMNKFQANEIQNISMNLEAKGFHSLDDSEKQIIGNVVSEQLKTYYSDKFMLSALAVMEMYDNDRFNELKDLDFGFISNPMKNKNDMNEIEIKQNTRRLEILKRFASFSHNDVKVGFDSNGRPFISQWISRYNFEGIVYLDNKEVTIVNPIVVAV
jgi:hypothetical protein